jgi:2-oxoglutarate dehydrogenase complex dehydrogenase (E1) component-like enzyme
MNIKWLTSKLPRAVKHAVNDAVKGGISSAFGKHASAGDAAHAFVNELGHYAVSAAKDLTEEHVQSLLGNGFHPVAEMDPTQQLQQAMPDHIMSDATVAELVNKAVQQALKQANAEFGDTLKRIADQRDQLAAQLEQTKAQAPAPTNPVKG